MQAFKILYENQRNLLKLNKKLGYLSIKLFLYLIDNKSWFYFIFRLENNLS